MYYEKKRGSFLSLISEAIFLHLLRTKIEEKNVAHVAMRLGKIKVN